MARKIQDRPKRLTYVLRNSRNSVKETDIMSSDDDIDNPVPLRKKVRKEFSVSELRKNSEHFKSDEDHLYSKSSNVDEIHNPTVRGLRRGIKIRSKSSSKSHSDEFDSDRDSTERMTENLQSGKRPKCSSKNAVMARINREKKKQYISSLENSNKHLQEQNDELIENVKKQDKTIEALKHEVIYLKSLLANSKEISEILKNLKNSTGLPVSSSLQTAVPGDQYSYEGQAQVKTVTSGLNFPILQDDVNLGNCQNQDDLSNKIDEESYFSFSGESDLSLDDILWNEDNFNFNSSLLDQSLEKGLENNFSKEELPKTTDLESNVGLCLHINKRKISVELCSICNNRAQSQEREGAGGDTHWMIFRLNPLMLKCKRASLGIRARSADIIVSLDNVEPEFSVGPVTGRDERRKRSKY